VGLENRLVGIEHQPDPQVALGRVGGDRCFAEFLDGQPTAGQGGQQEGAVRAIGRQGFAGRQHDQDMAEFGERGMVGQGGVGLESGEHGRNLDGDVPLDS